MEVTFVNFKNEIKRAQSVIKDRYNMMECSEESYLFEVEPIEYDGIELDGMGVTIDIINKRINEIVLVDEFGETYDLLSDDQKKSIVNFLEKSLLLNYLINHKTKRLMYA